MCGKIQHTTTFVSVYLLTLFIVSDFIERRARFWSGLQRAFAMIPATLLPGFPTFDKCARKWRFFSLRTRVVCSWIRGSVESRIRGIAIGRICGFRDSRILVSTDPRIAWKLAFYIEIDWWAFRMKVQGHRDLDTRLYERTLRPECFAHILIPYTNSRIIFHN